MSDDEWKAAHCIECYPPAEHCDGCACHVRSLREGDRVTIGPGPKVWRVDSVARIGSKPPYARLRDGNWNRITMPLDNLTFLVGSDGP